MDAITSLFNSLWNGILGLFGFFWDGFVLVVNCFYWVFCFIQWIFTEFIVILLGIITAVITFIQAIFNADWMNSKQPFDSFFPMSSGPDAFSNGFKNISLGLWNLNEYVRAGIYYFQQQFSSFSLLSAIEENQDTLRDLNLITSNLMDQFDIQEIQPYIGSFPDVDLATNFNLTMFIGHFRYVVGDTLYQLVVVSLIVLVLFALLDLASRLIDFIFKIIPFVG